MDDSLGDKNRKDNRYLQALEQRVLIFDGAMGTSIQAHNLTATDFGGKEGCNEYLVLVKPQIIADTHASFLEVGCDVLETDTFGGSRLKLGEYGLAEQTYEVNYTAAQLARRVADRYSTPDKPRFVAGSMGPTGMLPSSDDPTLGAITFDELAEIFAEQARPLVEGGCDLLIIETMQDILEVKAAIAGITRYFTTSGAWVPVQAQVTLDTSGRMLLGTDIAAVMATLETLPVDIIGLNCSTGPQHMREPIRYLCEHTSKYVSVIPNAGIPLNVSGQAVYPLEPAPMAQALAEFVSEFGANVIGGCCGTTPAHLKAVVEAVGSQPPKVKETPEEPLVSSGIRAVSLLQDPRPLLVGERVNAQGSRKVKAMLLNDDYDGLVSVAREQVESGAHVLDICVALTERTDEVEMMCKAIKKISMGVEAPLVIDSTEPAVISGALKTYPGRAIVNSINMENGRERIDNVLPLVKEHGAAVIALTIDQVGMAKTAAHKLEVARHIYEIVTGEYGLAPDALIFDVLTFPLSTGQEDLQASGLETLEGIRLVKRELPGVLTILGVSNVSFGLTPPARAVLNSVFLHHAVEAGLDLAIINPAHITPYAEIPAEQQRLADDLINNVDINALPRYIAYFEENKDADGQKQVLEDPTAGMNPAQRIHYQILHRKKEGIEARLDDALKTFGPVAVLNEILLPAMKDVGDKFGAGELILPFVLQSAEVMKKAVAHLEQFLEKKEGYTKGKVVLATVFGDVHDIGKSLVNTILTNNGYSVYDLGKQVPMNRIIDKAIEVGADAIGLSALLVSTSKQMPLIVQELHKRGLTFPVVIGGAAINRAYGRRILYVNDTQTYEPGVFYAKDAFEGLEIIDQLTGQEKREPFITRIRQEAAESKAKEATAAAQRAAAPAQVLPARSKVSIAASIPIPPFWGVKVLDRIALEDVFAYLDLNALYRGRWAQGKVHGEEYERIVREEFEPRLERMKLEARTRGYLRPRVIYGYFPAQTDGDDLIVYNPQNHKTELTRFSFPRQQTPERLCLADYFAAVQSSRMDVVALQVVTVGPRSSELSDKLMKGGNYSEAMYLHGLSVQCAEALAEYANRVIQGELNLSGDRGRRYSWGYAAIPDLEDHKKVFSILPVQEGIGVELSDGYQLIPEQSTAALIVHHPEASYFAVRL